MSRRGNLIVSFVFVFVTPHLFFSSFSAEKGADKQAMKGVVVCSAGQVGEANKTRLYGLSAGFVGLG